MQKIDNICYYCMAKLDSPNARCKACGNTNATLQNEPVQLPAGSVLDNRYTVGRVLGQGGFGITYLGFHTKLEEKLAIKEYFPRGFAARDTTRSTVMPVQGQKNQVFLNGKARFLNEAKTLTRFRNDPGIVHVREYFEENETAYIVMDYVEGKTLKQLAREHGGKLPAAQVLQYLRPIMQSLSRIHQTKLLHRDISPDNIIVTPDGQAVLIDFGAARQMSIDGEYSTTINVKHGFAPYEQYSTRGDQGPWTDVYSMCATIYCLTTGKIPPSALERMRNRIPLDFSAPGLTLSQAAAVTKGLSVNEGDRQQSMEALMQELFYEPAGDPPPEAPDDPEDGKTRILLNPVAAPRKALPTKRIVGIGSLLLILLGLGIAIFRLVTIPEEPTEASPEPTVYTEAEHGSVSEATTDVQQTAIPVPSAEENAAYTAQDALQLAAIARDAGNITEMQRLLPNRISIFDMLLAVDQADRIRYFGKPCFGDGDIALNPLTGECALSNWEQEKVRQVAEVSKYAAALTVDGNVLLSEYTFQGATETEVNSYAQPLLRKARQWDTITQLSAAPSHIVGLREDGRAVATGINTFDQCGVDDWQGIVQVAAGRKLTLGLKGDGTVLCTLAEKDIQRDIALWDDVVQVAADPGASIYYALGLRRDGTVLTAGPCAELKIDTENWHDVVSIAACYGCVAGLTADGDLLWTGEKPFDDMPEWSNLIEIDVGHDFIAGMTTDGEIVTYGRNRYGRKNTDGCNLLH